MIVSGIEYTNAGAAELVGFNFDEPGDVRVPLKGFRMSIDWSLERYCTGYFRIGTEGFARRDCVARTQVLRGSQCARCGARDQSRLLHHGSLSDAGVTKYLEAAHFLYVAAFGDGSLKAGTVHSGRFPTRLLEQGACYARLIAKDDGLGIRRLESMISLDLGLRQRVGVKAKLDALSLGLSNNAIESSLSEWIIRAGGGVTAALQRNGSEAMDESWENSAFTQFNAANKGQPRAVRPFDETKGVADFRSHTTVGPVGIWHDASGIQILQDFSDLKGRSIWFSDEADVPVEHQMRLF